MKFAHPLVAGTLLRRYKRFLADVALADGGTVTAHCPNTGSMLGCAEPGSPVWLSPARGAGRKLAFTWELVQVAEGALVGVNPGLANRLVAEALARDGIEELRGYPRLRREVRYGAENSRIDLLLEGAEGVPPCYLEVKSVTALAGTAAIFPDAVSARGTKHLRELTAVVASGARAALCFCVQRGDAVAVRPADEIDPLYGRTLRQALAGGVEVIAYRARVDPAGIELAERLPVRP